MSKFRQGCSLYFGGFEIWSFFLCWQIFYLFVSVSQNFRYYFGSDKFSAIFFGSTNFCTIHLNPLNQENITLKNI